MNLCFIHVIINIEGNMSNLLQFKPKPLEDKKTQETYDATVLPFKKKQDKGLFIQTDKLQEVFSLEDFFQSDDDVFFMG